MPYTIHRQVVRHSYSFSPSLKKKTQLLWPLLTSRSVSPRRPFRHEARSPQGKNALLHCTTAGFTPLRLDHESFADHCPLALLGSALYPVLVHRLAVSLHASSPRSVALTQLRFTSLAVVSLRRDLHPQECAHAGRTTKKAYRSTPFGRVQAWVRRQAACVRPLPAAGPDRRPPASSDRTAAGGRHGRPAGRS